MKETNRAHAHWHTGKFFIALIGTSVGVTFWRRAPSVPTFALHCVFVSHMSLTGTPLFPDANSVARVHKSLSRLQSTTHLYRWVSVRHVVVAAEPELVAQHGPQVSPHGTQSTASCDAHALMHEENEEEENYEDEEEEEEEEVLLLLIAWAPSECKSIWSPSKTLAGTVMSSSYLFITKTVMNTSASLSPSSPASISFIVGDIIIIKIDTDLSQSIIVIISYFWRSFFRFVHPPFSSALIPSSSSTLSSSCSTTCLQDSYSYRFGMSWTLFLLFRLHSSPSSTCTFVSSPSLSTRKMEYVRIQSRLDA